MPLYCYVLLGPGQHTAGAQGIIVAEFHEVGFSPITSFHKDLPIETTNLSTNPESYSQRGLYVPSLESLLRQAHPHLVPALLLFCLTSAAPVGLVLVTLSFMGF